MHHAQSSLCSITVVKLMLSVIFKVRQTDVDMCNLAGQNIYTMNIQSETN